MNEEHETAKAHSTRLIPPPIPCKGALNPKSAEVSEKELSPTFKKKLLMIIYTSQIRR